MRTSARQTSRTRLGGRARRLARPALVALPLALLAGCGSDRPMLADAPAGSNASVCALVESAAKKLSAQDGQPADIRDGAAEIREAAARADDQALQAAGTAYAEAAMDFADAVASEDPAEILLARGDLERQTPPLGDTCGVPYDVLLTF